MDRLLSTWNTLYVTDQSFMIEAVEQLNINPQLNATLIKSLQQITTKIQSQVGTNVHTLLFLETKLLSWYSTRNSINLGPEDLLVLLLLCQKTWRRDTLSESRAYASKSRSSTSREKTRSSSSETTDIGSRLSLSSSENESTGFHSSRENLLESLDQEDEWDLVEDMENAISYGIYVLVFR